MIARHVRLQIADLASRSYAMSTTDEMPTPATRADLAALDAQQFAILTTYRRSGVAVPTTVWFAHDDGILYVQTGPEAGKLRRIRANGTVTLTPSTRVGEPLGATMAAQARIVGADDAAHAEAALDRKYAEARKQLMARMFGEGIPMVRSYLAIEPAS